MVEPCEGEGEGEGEGERQGLEWVRAYAPGGVLQKPHGARLGDSGRNSSPAA